MNTESKQPSRLWLALPTAIAAGVTNVFVFFLFMVLYGHVIDSGHPDEYYQEAANRFGPYSSIIAGMPIMYAAGSLLRRFLQERALKVGIAAWFIYLVLDVAIIIGAGQFTAFMPLVMISFATKLAAVYFGARYTAPTMNGENQ